MRARRQVVPRDSPCHSSPNERRVRPVGVVHMVLQALLAVGHCALGLAKATSREWILQAPRRRRPQEQH